MTSPISSVVRVAASPEQAKLFVSLLAAEGIPAHTDGDSLSDEMAVSRRMMNLIGTQVLVPTASLERAREILAAVQVDEADLEAQALAAEAPETPKARPAAPTTPSGTGRWPLVLAVGAAIVFLGLWLSEVDARASARHPFLKYEPTQTGMRELRIADGTPLAEYFDRNRDGAYEEILQFADRGQGTVAKDEDRDGRFETYVEQRPGGVTSTWMDADRDGMFETCTVADQAGKVLQVLRWIDGTGFVVQPR